MLLLVRGQHVICTFWLEIRTLLSTEQPSTAALSPPPLLGATVVLYLVLHGAVRWRIALQPVCPASAGVGVSAGRPVLQRP